MKKLIMFVVVFFLCVASAFAGDEEKMNSWRGVNRVDSFIGVKEIFSPSGNRFSAYGNIIIYPWTSADGENLFGAGYKGNYWESSAGHGERHLGQIATRGYREWGDFRVSILGGVQNESYGKNNSRYNLYGIGGFLSLNHKDSDGKNYFPKTEFWGQILKADGQNSKSDTTGIIDVGGRQYLLHESFIKPFVEANLSLGTPDKYASLGVGIGITDRREILFLSAGPYWDLRHGGTFSFVNAGLDTSNLVSAIIKHNARNQVTEAPK